MTGRRSGARIALFAAGGRVALQALQALAEAHRVVAVLRPRIHSRRMLRSVGARLVGMTRLRPDPVARLAGTLGIPTIVVRHADDPGAAARLAALRPDFGCIATFPIRVGEALRAASGAACLNLHLSALPRHRGADPLFWTYHAGDPDGGVTVHVACDRLDAGPIVSAAGFPIERGEDVTLVHGRCAEVGAKLLVDAVRSMSVRDVRPVEQDEAGSTDAPRVQVGRAYSDLERWPAAHAWHFLAGLASRYQEPFRDVDGRFVRYTRVLGYEQREPDERAGTIRRSPTGWTAWTADGAVFLAP